MLIPTYTNHAPSYNPYKEEKLRLFNGRIDKLISDIYDSSLREDDKQYMYQEIKGKIDKHKNKSQKSNTNTFTL